MKDQPRARPPLPSTLSLEVGIDERTLNNRIVKDEPWPLLWLLVLLVFLHFSKETKERKVSVSTCLEGWGCRRCWRGGAAGAAGGVGLPALELEGWDCQRWSCRGGAAGAGVVRIGVVWHCNSCYAGELELPKKGR
ncbi:unnamed protein product [Cuscuta campestris]|uniref:Uncharacterized protein n=1 Tax=Cuscuta campestris TaxID=132261 RepID=A0A484NL05_9ASTE|nr:unnamed protein product [Cuscuta campestris]